MTGNIQRALGYLAIVLAVVSALLVPSAPAAADDPLCQPLPLATWGAELPGHQTVPAGGSVCFDVTAGGDGTHLVRSSQPVSGSAQLETRVRDQDGPLHASTTYWDLEDFFLDEGQEITVEVTNPTGTPLPVAVGVFDGSVDAGCVPYAASTEWDSAESEEITFAEPGTVSCHLFSEQGVGDDYTNWLVHPSTEPVRTEMRSSTGGGACQDVASLGSISSFANDGRSVCMLESASSEPRKALAYNVTRFANVPTAAASAELRVRSLADATGCEADLDQTLPPGSTAATFELDPTPQSINGADGRRCHLSYVGQGSRVYVELPDPDASWWLVDAAGRNQANKFQEVGGSTVRTRCNLALPCELEGVPPYRLLVEGPSGSDYQVGLRRISAPFGCVALPSIATGIPTQTGVVLQGGTRCYEFTGRTGDVIAPIATNPDQSGSRLPVSITSPGGSPIGSTPVSGTDVDLTLPEDGTYTLVVGPPDGGTSPYELTAACRAEPCGPFELDSVDNGDVGAGEVTLRLRGRGLAPATTDVVLRDGGTELPGSLYGGADDDRVLDVTVDLAGRTGTWDVVATSARGHVRVLTDAVVIKEDAAPPALGTTLSTNTNDEGVNVFAPGRRFRVTATITNVGDTDATGAPVILHDMPPGTIVEPNFDVTTLSEDGDIVPYPYDADTFTHQSTDQAATMMIVNRLGPGMTEVLDFFVTTPVDTEEWTLRARSGECLLTDVGTAPAPRPGRRTAAASDGGAACVFAIRDALAATLPGASCAAMLEDLPEAWAHDLAVLSGSQSFSWGNVFDRVIATNLATPGCAADIGVGTLKTLGKIIDAIAEGSDVIEGTSAILDACFPDEPMDQTPDVTEPGVPFDGPSGGPSGGPPGGSPLPLEPVNSLDPNAVVGPAGAGPERAHRGEGVQRYAVYFENDPGASAPAQEVRITSQLDPAVYDLDTLRFTRVAFGDTTYSPGRSSTVDQLIDVTADQSLGVQVDGAVSPAGELTVDLRAVDPATGRLPDNPLVGFLPPNANGTEGQGVITYEVGLHDVPSGTTVENTADIVFDLNDPITTNTWANLVDTDAPSAQIVAPDTATGPFPVTWSGTDATSGVARMDVYVAIDGGPYELWKDGVAPGTAIYTPEPGHSYSFGTVAFDWPHNRSVSDPPYGPTTVVSEPDTDPAVENVKRPKIIGLPIAGTGLLATVGTWNPWLVRPKVQWLRDGQPIPGATFWVYLLRRADVGHRISVEVTATAPGYAPGSAVSKKTARIKKGLLRRPPTADPG